MHERVGTIAVERGDGLIQQIHLRVRDAEKQVSSSHLRILGNGFAQFGGRFLGFAEPQLRHAQFLVGSRVLGIRIDGGKKPFFCIGKLARLNGFSALMERLVGLR